MSEYRELVRASIEKELLIRTSVKNQYEYVLQNVGSTRTSVGDQYRRVLKRFRINTEEYWKSIQISTDKRNVNTNEC